MTTGQLVSRIQPSTMIVFGALKLLTLLAGPAFCGWICPFGTIQLKELEGAAASFTTESFRTGLNERSTAGK